MTALTNQVKEGRTVARMLALLAFVAAPGLAMSSCSEDPVQAPLSMAQMPLTCGGLTRAGGGTVCPPNDACVTWACVSGACTPTQVLEPGATCVEPDHTRGRCGYVDLDGDRRPDSYVCCSGGCLDSRLNCVPYTEQTDLACGRTGVDCRVCGDCRQCDTGSCVAAGNGTTCPNGTCQGGGCCTGCLANGVCIVDAVNACGSGGGACTDCDDGRTCTTDACTGGQCTHTNVGPGTGCDDGNQCTTNDACSGSTCAGSPKDCNDNNVCTSDNCNQGTGCTHVPVGGSCNDGNACTGPADSCVNGTCTGPAVSCDDGNQCTTDSCNPDTGCTHTSKAEGATCNDGSSCSTGDRCHDDDNNPNTPRVCEPTGGPNCEDGNPCTSDVADCVATPPTCPHTATNNNGPCGTGDLCRVGQICTAGTCGGGTMVNCDDFNPCTTDACAAATGCTHVPVAGTPACNDGDPCTTGDACDTGACTGTAVECTASDDCHRPGTCDPASGTCSDLRKANGSACGRTGTCQSGTCQGDGVVEPPPGGAGAPSGAGAPGDAGASTGGTAGTSTGGTGNSGGDEAVGGTGATGTSGTSNAGETGTPEGDLYVREPGGCKCSVPTSPGGRGYGALAFLSALLLVGRRRRHAA